ncbi:MFS transporter [Phenylobacterium sp. LH3H17]|uniref:MFS transporter n=1 Tax=Phenylobacterium sp. LH3H17 TaxID=2903901 RepID=UPI0020C9FADC|nr:MFS transporter [Phenylobacterium sp. LH3H17]UTP39876.1 MFS transporter [Phenylobacterium sp. LH3H17]
MSEAPPSRDRRLPLSLVFGFASLSVPLGAYAVAVAVYLPAYFAKHLGVSLAVIGGAWAVVRLIDLVVDPILGVAMDRTRTRLGRYRAWMLLGGPIMMAATYALFLAPAGIGSIYLIGWLLVLYLGTSILGLGHSAWAATLAPEYNERSRVFGVLAAAGVVGAVAVLMIPIIADGMGLSEAKGVQAQGWFILGLIPLAVLLTARTPEKLLPLSPGPAFALKDYVRLLLKPDLLRLFLAQMSLTMGPGWMSALYLFFFTDARGYSAEQASILLLVYVVAGVLGAPTTAFVATRFGKHKTLMATTTAYSLALCTVMLVPKGSVAWGLPVMLWCGFMAAGFDLMIRAMLADVADEVRLEQGREQISLIYALNSLGAKIAAAFAIGVTFPLLGQLGYDAAAGAVNTPEAIRSLEIAFIAGPIVFVMLGGACLIGWRLDSVRHAEIRIRLDAHDAQYAEAPVVESLGTEPAIPVLAPDGKPG